MNKQLMMDLLVKFPVMVVIEDGFRGALNQLQ